MPETHDPNHSISPSGLAVNTGPAFGPQVVDVRRRPAFEKSETIIAGAIWRDPEVLENWAGDLDLARPIAVYCVHGHEVSQNAAAALRALGYPARFIEGGFEGLKAASWKLAKKPETPSLWVTRERPKIDRIACPWLIRRFIDPDARFLYVPSAKVMATAGETGATPFDIPGVEYSHDGELCSFDAFIQKHDLRDPALLALAKCVRGADTDKLGLDERAAGLYAISLGLSANITDDQVMLRHGLVIYDALYRWYAELTGEAHNWPPAMGQESAS